MWTCSSMWIACLYSLRDSFLKIPKVKSDLKLVNLQMNCLNVIFTIISYHTAQILQNEAATNISSIYAIIKIHMTKGASGDKPVSEQHTLGYISNSPVCLAICATAQQEQNIEQHKSSCPIHLSSLIEYFFLTPSRVL